MEAVETELLETEAPPVARVPMTKAQFLTWNPEDEFLYEYKNGFALRISGMKKEERYLIVNIQDRFAKTSSYQQGDRLLAETDCWLTETQMRRPDLALFTQAQIRVGEDDAEPIPAFVVELISPSDRADKIEEKVLDYFEAGVRVVWHVFPALRMVRVFTSARTATTFFGEESFAAAPALPDLQLTVAELFA